MNNSFGWIYFHYLWLAFLHAFDFMDKLSPSNILSLAFNSWNININTTKHSKWFSLIFRLFNPIGHRLFQLQIVIRFSIFILYDQVEHEYIERNNFFVLITFFSKFVKLVLRASRNACTIDPVSIPIQRRFPFKCTTKAKTTPTGTPTRKYAPRFT